MSDQPFEQEDSAPDLVEGPIPPVPSTDVQDSMAEPGEDV